MRSEGSKGSERSERQSAPARRNGSGLRALRPGALPPAELPTYCASKAAAKTAYHLTEKELKELPMLKRKLKVKPRKSDEFVKEKQLLVMNSEFIFKSPHNNMTIIIILNDLI